MDQLPLQLIDIFLQTGVGCLQTTVAKEQEGFAALEKHKIKQMYQKLGEDCYFGLLKQKSRLMPKFFGFLQQMARI